MSSQEVIDTLGDLKILTNKMINQLRQLEIFITTNRTDRAKILRAPISPAEKETAVSKLDLIFHQALNMRSTGHALLKDLEKSLS